MRSWQSRVFEKIVVLSGRKKKFLSVTSMQAFIDGNRNRARYTLKSAYMKKHHILTLLNDEMEVYVLNSNSNTGKSILYLPGGAYINEPTNFHWRYIVKLAKKTGHKIYVPIYPKLPNFTHEDCYKQLDLLYLDVLRKDPNELIFMGDSAGGGLALAFAQKLFLASRKGPSRLILFSPWLDLSADDPAYIELETIDPMIGSLGAKMLGELWAAQVELSNPLVSPMYGPIKQLGKISIFVGTAEMLLIDAQRFHARAQSEGVEIEYYEYESMNHAFALFPIPEAEDVLNKVIYLLIEDSEILVLG